MPDVEVGERFLLLRYDAARRWTNGVRDEWPSGYVANGVSIMKIPASQSIDLSPRCKRCGWPLAESRDKGCVEGDCSYRPADGSPEWQRMKERDAELRTQQAVSQDEFPAESTPLPDHARTDLKAIRVADELREIARRVRNLHSALNTEYELARKLDAIANRLDKVEEG